jgi:hypothetical protein
MFIVICVVFPWRSTIFVTCPKSMRYRNRSQLPPAPRRIAEVLRPRRMNILTIRQLHFLAFDGLIDETNAGFGCITNVFIITGFHEFRKNPR